MGLWKGAWRLASFELRTSWGGVLLTFLFFAYMALIGRLIQLVALVLPVWVFYFGLQYAVIDRPPLAEYVNFPESVELTR